MNRIRTLTALAALALLAAPALAKKNDPNIELEYKPQQAVAGSSAGIRSAARQTPLHLVLKDGRGLDDPFEIGTRTNDHDQLFDLRATNEVAPFAEFVLLRNAEEWGVEPSEDADLTLEVELLTFDIDETNQAMGATFVATVKLYSELKDSSGKVLWSGRSEGDATRWGKKFSNANCNEVLSDALREANANLLGDSQLQKVWGGD